MKPEAGAKTFEFFPSPQYALLQGADAEAFLEEFNAKADKMYKDAAKNVKVLSYDPQNRLVRGSNPFAVVHANALLRPQGVLTASQAGLEAFRENLRGCYEDSALVLRSTDDPEYAQNAYVAQNLAEQMPKPFRKSVGNVPLVVPLTDLDLVADGKSAYGLTFKLLDGAHVYEAPILAKVTGNFRSEDVDKETGLPTKLGKGDRTLYTRNNGLSRLCLYRYLGVGSYYWGLAGSDDGGRVVVSRGEAARAGNR